MMMITKITMMIIMIIIMIIMIIIIIIIIIRRTGRRSLPSAEEERAEMRSLVGSCFWWEGVSFI